VEVLPGQCEQQLEVHRLERQEGTRVRCRHIVEITIRAEAARSSSTG
jgi:hypothetical protein